MSRNPFSSKEVIRYGRYFKGGRQFTDKGKKELSMIQQNIDNAHASLGVKEKAFKKALNSGDNAKAKKLEQEIMDLEDSLAHDWGRQVQNLQDRKKFVQTSKGVGIMGAIPVGAFLAKKVMSKNKKKAFNYKNALKDTAMYGAGIATPVAMMSGLAYYGDKMDKKANAREFIKEAFIIPATGAIGGYKGSKEKTPGTLGGAIGGTIAGVLGEAVGGGTAGLAVALKDGKIMRQLESKNPQIRNKGLLKLKSLSLLGGAAVGLPAAYYGGKLSGRLIGGKKKEMKKKANVQEYLIEKLAMSKRHVVIGTANDLFNPFTRFNRAKQSYKKHGVDWNEKNLNNIEPRKMERVIRDAWAREDERMARPPGYNRAKVKKSVQNWSSKNLPTFTKWKNNAMAKITK